MEGLKESSPDFIDGEDFESRLDFYREAYEPVEVRFSFLRMDDSSRSLISFLVHIVREPS